MEDHLAAAPATNAPNSEFQIQNSG